MGNIPLAAILYNNGVSFGGVMAFIFSDLVVFPVIRVDAKYYGWKMALYIVGLLFASLVATSLVLHYGFSWLGVLPQMPSQSAAGSAQESRFAIDYTFFLNLLFLAITGVLAWLQFGGQADSQKSESEGKKNESHHEHHHHKHHHGGGKQIVEQVLFLLAIAAYLWLAGGLIATAANL